MTDLKEPVITIDGASGTGKGTVSQLLAARLGWNFLDSGALYRVLAIAAQKHSVALDNERALEVLGEYLDVQFIANPDKSPKIILESEDITNNIRTEAVGNMASIVAALPAVRASLLSRQRAFREAPGLVTDGRDMGTVVFPDAEHKFFLTAGPETRAERRYKQLKEQGLDVNLGGLLEELRLRDKRDSERAIINTDHLSVAQVVEKILEEISRKKAFPAPAFLMMEIHNAAVAE
jgi:cytidylate kinase